MAKHAKKQKRSLCLFMALLFMFLTSGSITTLAKAEEENSTISFEPSLTNGIFKNESCSSILSTSFNRATLTILLFLDLVQQDQISMDVLADTVVNSYVGKPNHETLSDLSILVSMYNDNSIYLITYTPLLGQGNFNTIENNAMSDSLIKLLLDSVTIDNQKNSIADILEVLKMIQSAINE